MLTLDVTMLTLMQPGTPLMYAVKHDLGPLTVEVLLELCDFSADEWASGKALYYTTVTKNIKTMQLVMTQRAQRLRGLIGRCNVLVNCCSLATDEEVGERVDFLLNMGADPTLPGALENLRWRCTRIIDPRIRQEFESTLTHLNMAAMSVR